MVEQFSMMCIGKCWVVMATLAKGPEILAAIEKEFGSFDQWKADFKAACIAAKLSGWGVLTFDQLYSGRLLNVLVDEHHYGAIWGEFL
jgi:superoxide dismutase